MRGVVLPHWKVYRFIWRILVFLAFVSLLVTPLTIAVLMTNGFFEATDIVPRFCEFMGEHKMCKQGFPVRRYAGIVVGRVDDKLYVTPAQQYEVLSISGAPEGLGYGDFVQGTCSYLSSGDCFVLKSVVKLQTRRPPEVDAEENFLAVEK